MKKLLKMFLVFLKIGAFTFGGGYAMIPLIEEEIVNKNKWVEEVVYNNKKYEILLMPYILNVLIFIINIIE